MNRKIGPLFRAVGNQSREKIPSKPDNRDRPRTGPAPVTSKDVEFKKRVIEVRQKRIIEDLKKLQDEAVELDRVLEQLGA